MRLNAVKILKIRFTIDTRKDILEEIRKYLIATDKKPQKAVKIFTPNTEQLVFAQKNREFASLLNQADIAIPDTIGVVWAGRVLTENGPSKHIPGVEFMEDLAELAAKLRVPIGLIGGRDKVAVDTLDCLQKKYSGLTGWATDGPEITGSGDLGDVYVTGYVNRIHDSKVKIVFVGLGPPKQEYFISALAPNLSNVVIMAVGGSFDILSGRFPRAPAIFRSLGLEWFWRLLLEPRRWRRQLALIEFVWLVLKNRFIDKH